MSCLSPYYPPSFALTVSQDNPRTIAILVAAKSNDLDLELVKTEANSSASFNRSAEYAKLNPLGKIPSFEGANGYTLSEAIAIAIYGKYYRLYFLSPEILSSI